MKLRLLHLIALICITGVAPEVQACQCFEYETPVCAAFWRADAVFVGQLVDIKPLQNSPDKDFRYISLHFRLEHSFRGISGTHVDVGTTAGNICDFVFRKGQEYIVYAWREEAGRRLFTSGLCLRTRLLKNAAEDLAYIRTVMDGTAGESISGKLQRDYSVGIPGFKVTVEGNGQTFETISDKKGNFSFALPGPGTFKVRVFVPYEAGVLRYDENVDTQTTGDSKLTTVEYEVKLRKSQCHYHLLEIFKL